MSTPTERSALVARLARFALRLVLAGAGLYLLWSGGLVLANFAVLGVPEPPDAETAALAVASGLLFSLLPLGRVAPRSGRWALATLALFAPIGLAYGWRAAQGTSPLDTLEGLTLPVGLVAAALAALILAVPKADRLYGREGPMTKSGRTIGSDT